MTAAVIMTVTETEGSRTVVVTGIGNVIGAGIEIAVGIVDEAAVRTGITTLTVAGIVIERIETAAGTLTRTGGRTEAEILGTGTA